MLNQERIAKLKDIVAGQRDLMFAAERHIWKHPETGYRGDLKRQSDVYVFCHYTQKARSKADPLALDDWDFYVISTRKLDEVCGAQKTISLASLQLLGPIRADYSGIKEAIIHCIRGYECTPLHTHHPPTLGILHNFRI